MFLGYERSPLILREGEATTVQFRQPHTFGNQSDYPTVMIVETRPAGGVIKAFRLAYAIANQGGAGRDGLPRNPLIRLRFIDISQGFIPQLPLWFQRVVFGAARLLSRITGTEKRISAILGNDNKISRS